MSEHIIERSSRKDGYTWYTETVEHEEIIRCRDCDYYDHWDACGRYREKHVCGHWDFLEIEPDGFCAWAERKD